MSSQATYIQFHNPEIAQLFEALLLDRGVPCTILGPQATPPAGAPLVTEPPLARRHSDLSRALLVGKAASMDDLQGIHLSQPLTELKVSQAIEQFMRVLS